MSEWKVALTFVEGGSSKFWRARIEGATLFVNYGRIGAAGQTQVKDLASADAAEKELAKLEREKRKKGYVDEGAGGAGGAAARGDDEDDEGGEGEEEEGDQGEDDTVEVLKSAIPNAPAREHFESSAEGRKIELELALEGNTVRTTVSEHYDSPAGAKAAFERLKTSMSAEGYKRTQR